MSISCHTDKLKGFSFIFFRTCAIKLTLDFNYDLFDVNITSRFYELATDRNFSKFWRLKLPIIQTILKFLVQSSCSLNMLVLGSQAFSNRSFIKVKTTSKHFFNPYFSWLYVLVISRTCFRVNPHSIVAWMSRNSLLEAGAKSEG